MNSKLHDEPPDTAARPAQAIQSDVLIFVDSAQKEMPALHHAQKVARAFQGNVVILHVMSEASNHNGPIDPVDWNLKKQKNLKWLDSLAQTLTGGGQTCEVKLLEGPCIGQIAALAELRHRDITAAIRSSNGLRWHVSETACGVLESRSAAILMIPEDADFAKDQSYRRIMVPLDGSSRAEAALPMAVMLANAEQAELLLCYVMPDPGLTEFGIKDPESERLHDLVIQRNAKSGETHLTSIKKSLASSGLKVSTHVLQGGDARRVLLDFVSQEAVDFLVMASHGQSGHSDVATGDVARFILDRVDIPVLMVRHARGRNNAHAFRNPASKGVRQPTGTDG